SEEESTQRRHRRNEDGSRDRALRRSVSKKLAAQRADGDQETAGGARDDAGEDAVSAGAAQDSGATRWSLRRRRSARARQRPPAHQEHDRRGEPRQRALGLVARLA